MLRYRLLDSLLFYSKPTY